MQPPARPVSLAEARGGIDWHWGRIAGAMGGVFIGVSAFLPLSVLLMPIGGAITVAIYNSRSLRKIVRPGEGAKLASVAAAVGFLLFTAAMAVVLKVRGSQFWDWLVGVMKEQAAATGRDFKPVGDLLATPDGRAVFAVVMMIAMLLMMVLLAALGGAIGAAFTHRRERP